MQSQDKIITVEKYLELRATKLKDKKIVFTNGCFDIVHLGHIDYLEKAKDKGDVLVLGLNTDSSIQRIKGKSRPIVDENSRARLMAAMQFIDYVILFEQDTPLQLIRTIIPDVLVKGNDYQQSNIVGADIVLSNGGKVETIQLVPGYSTSNIIEKIKEN